MAEPKYKVLLVEDNEDHIYIFQTYLSLVETVSIESVVVPRLEDALQKVKEDHFDIVLLDLMLPDSRGLDTFTKFYQAFPDIPVVVITALSDEEFGIKAVQSGAQDYLIKGDINSNILSRSLVYALIRHEKDENLRQLAEKSAEIFGERRQTPTMLVFDGHNAALEINYWARLAMDLPDGKKAGEEVRFRGASFFVIRDGRISRLTDYM